MKKSRVTIAKSKTGQLPTHIKKRVEESKQLKARNDWAINNGLINPPYSPEGLMIYYDHNSTFYAVVNQIAVDVAGLGWSILPKDKDSENASELKAVKEVLDNIVPESSLRTLFKELLIDWGVVGYFGVEVIRNLKGQVSKLVRVPAHTIRIYKDGSKYCQVKNQKKVWFRKFGSEENISYETGKATDNQEKLANEMIYYRNPSQSSEFYGSPNIISAMSDLSGLVESSTYNLAFFENFGVPVSIVTLKGLWEENSANQIKKFITTEIKGSDNGHKSLILELDPESEFNIDELSSKIKDSSFMEYRKENKENILSCYSMPPERIGVSVTGPLGGEKVYAANEIYRQAVVLPLKEDIEEIMNRIFSEGLEVDTYKFKFKNLDLESRSERVERVTKLVDRGIITGNEARKELGLPPIGPEGDVLSRSGQFEEIGVVNVEE